MATTSSESDYSRKNNENKENYNNGTNILECNICLDNAKDPVANVCGHLFCWPCLHQWLKTRQACPICKAIISKDKVIPIYGHGSTRQEDHRNKIPPRPAGQRTELVTHFTGFNFGDGNFRLFFGIATFPFQFITSIFSDSPHGVPVDDQLQQHDDYLITIIFWFAVVFFILLLLA